MATVRAPRAYCGRFDQSPILVLKGRFRHMTARTLRSFIDDLLVQQPGDFRDPSVVFQPRFLLEAQV